jgi:hypothetical protein
MSMNRNFSMPNLPGMIPNNQSWLYVSCYFFECNIVYLFFHVREKEKVFEKVDQKVQQLVAWEQLLQTWTWV